MLNLHISDMTCGHCVNAITQAVQAVAPGATLAFDLPTHHLQVNGATDHNVIEAAIRDAGYKPIRQN
ncbi:heavy-metal-associated domain-containing protein [Alcaligenaceae bacterium]|nr:heavy-metal-associated domain-containing protein [Alcaligenaceae bacterium]